MTTIEANPYATPELQRVIEAYQSDPRERALLVQATRNLLPEDDRLLAAGAANAVATLTLHLAKQRTGVELDLADLLGAAEGIVQMALAIRADGMPKLPQRS
jgi:hypothetical protein